MPSEISHPPHSTTLLNSMRSVGYTLESAVADIIDNSITAGANCISVLFDKGDETSGPWLAICDNGCGMSRETLLQSMRFGSREETEDVRHVRDLGRYGLGMKTASLSQCRKLTVFSWQDGIGHAFCWDLDHVGDNWTLLELEADFVHQNSILNFVLAKLSSRGQVPFNPASQGTIVLWECLDRDNLQRAVIDASMLQVREHISLVFHRFMRREADGHPIIRFDMNHMAVKPANPFAEEDSRCEKLWPDTCWCDNRAMTAYQVYLIPNDPAYAGNGGFVQNQGFYVYRNKRLIQKATWLRLRPKEQATQFLRIQLDVAADHDARWQVDVRKSQVTPPADVRNWLELRLPQACKAARDTFYSYMLNLVRSTPDKRQPVGQTWKVTQDTRGVYHYHIDHNNELLQLIRKELPAETRVLLRQYLDNIVRLFPYDYCRLAPEAESEDAEDAPLPQALADNEAVQLLSALKKAGKSPEDIRYFLKKHQVYMNPKTLEQNL